MPYRQSTPQQIVDISSPLGPRVHLQKFLGAASYEASRTVALPEGCDPAVWQYEQLRELTKELGLLSVALNQVCTAGTCPVMCATDQWHYLCAAHKTPKECSAIDYMLHTLEGTSAMLGSNKYFPHSAEIPADSLKYFQSIARRLYRILAHAFFHHSAIFHEFEEKYHTCQRFEEFVLVFDLMPEKLLIIRCAPCEGTTPTAKAAAPQAAATVRRSQRKSSPPPL